jgi:CDGSH-type Zn-finger protein
MSITITVRQNGPFFISADEAPQVTILDHAGNRVEPKPGKGIALCRCGASVNKPFCDGTHSRIGFKGAEEARQDFDSAQQTPAAPAAPAAPAVPPAQG